MARRGLYIFLLTTFFLFFLSPRPTAQPVVLTLTVHTIAPACNASSGVIILSAAGGTGPYTFTFKGINAGSTGTFSGLSTGIYPVSVTDASGTTATQTVTLTQMINPPQVTISSFTNPLPRHLGQVIGFGVLVRFNRRKGSSYSQNTKNCNLSQQYAISGLIPARPLTTADTFALVMPRPFARPIMVGFTLVHE